MTEYEKFKQMMSDLEYFKKNGIPRSPYYIKDKDGNVLFDELFERFKIFNG